MCWVHLYGVSGPFIQLIRSLKGSTSQVFWDQISADWRHKEKYPPPGYKNRHSSITVPTSFRRTFGEDRSSSSFRPQDLNSSHSFLQRGITSLVFCPRSLQTFSSPVLNLRLFGSRNEATMSSVAFLPQVFQSHRSPGFPQIPFYTRAVTAIPKLSLSSSRTLKHVGAFPSFSARIGNHHCRTSVDSDFSIGNCRVLFRDAHRDST